jgi:hypothetical protein
MGGSSCRRAMKAAHSVSVMAGLLVATLAANGLGPRAVFRPAGSA